MYFISAEQNAERSFGEALVITNSGLARKFRTYMKQNGAVLAKGWLLGLQFCALLEDDTYEK